LKQSVFIAGSAFNIPVLTESSFLSKLSSTPTAPASLQLQIGDLETTVFFDGVVSLPSYQPVFAPEVPPDELRQQLQKLHMPIQMAEAGINVLLIRKGGRIILMDTGFGHLNPNAGKLVPALQALGFSRAMLLTSLLRTSILIMWAEYWMPTITPSSLRPFIILLKRIRVLDVCQS